MANELTSLLIVFSIIVLPYVIWRLAGLKSVLPCAVVQILLGIAFGPSVLGRVAPQLHAAFLPDVIQTQIAGVATLAILFFAFTTGLHVDISYYRGRGRGFIAVSIGSIVAPFVLGASAGWWVYGSYPESVGHVGISWFVLSVAVALSVTALPVLSAVLRELGLLHQALGQWSLGVAAVNDAALWIMVSVLLANARPGTVELSPTLTIVCGILYLAVMYSLVRPAFKEWSRNRPSADFSDATLIGVVALAIVSAFASQLIGLHYLLGAFIAGTVLPEPVRVAVLARIEPAMVFLLTPFFFIATGLKVSIDLSSATFIQICGMMTLTAILGKLVGTAVPARMIGLPWRQCLALGSLMQTKGMMELAVLSMLSDAGLVTGQIFSALVLMALITTALAMPLTRLFLPSDESIDRTNSDSNDARLTAPMPILGTTAASRRRTEMSTES